MLGGERLEARDQAVRGLLAGGLLGRQRRIGTICHDAKPKQSCTRAGENHEPFVMPITYRFKEDHGLPARLYLDFPVLTTRSNPVQSPRLESIRLMPKVTLM
ncbi:Protein of unknown function [Micromonospora lupini str. Lupac 08]|uniref:Uncharacterized protein n=1 Tax=Micromonospora lupini str. Lupac 08 TaxID=1150864 RepID=I0L8C5_9ACTN|nr:Protein of unknown function [Micromonospora lupini str. Lupac 08]